MAANLMDMAWNYLSSSGVIEKLGGAVGLSPEKTQELMKAIIPTVMGGAVQSASSESGAKRLSDTLSQGKFDGSMLGNLGNRFEGGGIDEVARTGKGVLENLFGGKLGTIEDVLARFSGAGKGSVMTLLAAAAPIVMNLLGKLKNEQGLSAGGLRELLLSQKDSIAKAAPPGLASAMGLSSLADLGGTAAAAKEKIGTYAGEARKEATAAAEAAERGAPSGSSVAKWVTAALACLALLAFIWFLRNRPDQVATKSPAPAPAPTETPAPADRPTLTGQPVGNLVTIQLPNGANLELERDSTAMEVAEFLRKAPAGSDTERFSLAGVAFESEAGEPTADSKPAIEKLAAVLKAYPDARVRIRSYVAAGTDGAESRRLSTDRASRIKTHLQDHGVPADRVQAEAMDQPSAETTEATEITIERGNR